MTRSAVHILYVITIAVLLSITGGLAFELVIQLVKAALNIEHKSFIFDALGVVGISLAMALFGMLSLGAVAYAATRKREWATMNAYMVETGPRAQSRVLIVGLSTSGVLGPEPKLKPGDALNRLREAGIEKAGDWKGNADQWDHDGATRHTWTMAICAVRRHIGRLEAIYILPSVETHEQAGRDFVPFLRTLLDDAGHSAVCVELACEQKDAPSYVEYNAVQDSLIAILERLKTEHSVLAKDVCIDATAGQKPFSIAAASVTYSTQALFSYVDTVSRKVMCYDARIDLGLFANP